MLDIVNNERYDLSDWLIHFFRDVDMASPNSIALPEFMGWTNAWEDDGKPIPAFYFLRCSIRQLRLWATWAFRNGRATIYGENPAVCFTDMPVAAFWEAAALREGRGENISPYGIMIRKSQMAKLGARPVIYGLSQKYHVDDGSHGRRLIDPQYLPLAEQYRFVAYGVTETHALDWTHEREWRWPFTSREILRSYLSRLAPGPLDSFENMPSLLFSDDALDGMGILVKTDLEAQLLLHDLLGLIDRNCITKSKFAFILSRESIPEPQALIHRANFEEQLQRSRIDPTAGLNTDASATESIMREFTQCCGGLEGGAAEGADSHESGRAWLWIHDPRHPLTRTLLKAGRITINADNRYLVNLDPQFAECSLPVQEKIVKDLAVKIKDHFGLECGYFSVSGHTDPNGVPFHTNPPAANKFLFNGNC